MSNPRERWLAFGSALTKARDSLINFGPLDNFEPGYDESIAAALAVLAPFFAQPVHARTPERPGHVAENHGTDAPELIAFAPIDSDESVCLYPFTVRKPRKGDLTVLVDCSQLEAHCDYEFELRVRRRP